MRAVMRPGWSSYPRLLGDIYVGPYLELAPELALVADDGERACGLCPRLCSTRQVRAGSCEEAVVATSPGDATSRPVRRGAAEGFDAELLNLVRNPELTRHPDFPGYPSHLHIDLMEHVRGRVSVVRCSQTLFQRLRAAGSPGVHLGVDAANVGAQRFYRRLGFVELRRVGTDLFMGLSWPGALMTCDGEELTCRALKGRRAPHAKRDCVSSRSAGKTARAWASRDPTGGGTSFGRGRHVWCCSPLRGTSDNASLYGKYLVEILLEMPAGLVSPSTLTAYGSRPDLTGRAGDRGVAKWWVA